MQPDLYRGFGKRLAEGAKVAVVLRKQTTSENP